MPCISKCSPLHLEVAQVGQALDVTTIVWMNEQVQYIIYHQHVQLDQEPEVLIYSTIPTLYHEQLPCASEDNACVHVTISVYAMHVGPFENNMHGNTWLQGSTLWTVFSSC